jgi:hypothetical protein
MRKFSSKNPIYRKTRYPAGPSNALRRVQMAREQGASSDGWKADPSGRHELRYHDGTTWTEHVADGGVTAQDPYDPADVATPPSSDLRLPYTAKGISGQVTVDEHFVTISRKGAKAKVSMGGTMRGEKRIPISSIQAVVLKRPGLQNGYIQFTIPGGIEASRRVRDVARNDDTVIFSTFHTAEFEAVRAFIEQKIIERHAGPVVVAAPQAVPDLADQIRKLAALRDDGLLSPEEFEAQKAKLL